MRQLWLAIYVPSFLIATGQQAVVVMLPLYAAALARSQHYVEAAATLAATLLTLRGAGSLLASVPAGLMVARWGDKAVMVGALTLLAGAALLLAVAATLESPLILLCIAAMAFGSGSGAWLLARLAYVSEAAPLAYRGRALAGLGGVQRLGLLVGPLVGGTLVTMFGFASAFAAAGISMLLAFLLIVPFTARIAPTRTEAHSPNLRSVVGIVHTYRRVFATAGVSVATLSVLRASRQMLLPLWGTLLGLTAQQVGITFTLSSALEIGMAYPAGYLVDRMGHKWAALPCFALLCLSVALLPWANTWPMLIGVALLAGIGNGFGAGIMMTFGSDYAPPARRGEFLGVWRMMGDAGQMAGPALIGAVAAAASLGVATLAAAAIGVCGLTLMAFAVQPPTRA